MPVPSQGHYGFHSFRLLTDFVCLYTYEFWLSLCKIVRSSVILLKKWWVESDFKAPKLPLSLQLKDFGCHYNSIYNNTGTYDICLLNWEIYEPCFVDHCLCICPIENKHYNYLIHEIIMTFDFHNNKVIVMLLIYRGNIFIFLFWLVIILFVLRFSASDW
jgi:hypothetical protein